MLSDPPCLDESTYLGDLDEYTYYRPRPNMLSDPPCLDESTYLCDLDESTYCGELHCTDFGVDQACEQWCIYPNLKACFRLS